MIPSLDLLPAGCLVTSLARDVRFANAFFRSDLGLDPAELTGRPLDALLTPASRIFYESYLHPMLLTEGLCTEASITFISGQGERVPVVVNARLLPGPDPMVIWCITRAENRDKIYEDLRQARETLQVNAKRLAELASTDALTGRPNRREFESRAERDIRSAERCGQSLGLVLIDIDHFKKINDNYGHAVGDDVLRNLGLKLLDVSRKHELVARYGGEEFICCLYGAEETSALAFANRIRVAVRTIDVKGRGVTVSIGIAIRPSGSGFGLAAMTNRADLALYQAKSAGRDLIVSYNETGFFASR